MDDIAFARNYDKLIKSQKFDEVMKDATKGASTTRAPLTDAIISSSQAEDAYGPYYTPLERGDPIFRYLHEHLFFPDRVASHQESQPGREDCIVHTSSNASGNLLSAPPTRRHGKRTALSPADLGRPEVPCAEHSSFHSKPQQDRQIPRAQSSAVRSSTSPEGRSNTDQPIVINLSSDTLFLDKTPRSDLVLTPSRPDRSVLRADTIGFGRYGAVPSTISSQHSTDLISQTSRAASSQPSTAVTSVQSEIGPKRSTARRQRENRSRRNMNSSAQDERPTRGLRYGCPFDRGYNRNGRQRCAGELNDGFEDMGRVK